MGWVLVGMNDATINSRLFNGFCCIKPLYSFSNVEIA